MGYMLLMNSFIEYDTELQQFVWWIGAQPKVLKATSPARAAIEVQQCILDGDIPKTVVDVSYIWK